METLSTLFHLHYYYPDLGDSGELSDLETWLQW